MTEGDQNIEQNSEENTETLKSQHDDIENQMLDHLMLSSDAHFKSQQRDENDLTTDEKREIASAILSSSKANFLSRFGKQLKEEHLDYFSRFTSDEYEGYDLNFYLQNLKRHFSKTKRNMDTKNRRYAALNRLLQDDNSYFTETEMMKRNPLLYDQLVGQYLSEEEKKKRDNIDTTNITFVNLLLEGIDRQNTREKQKRQQDDEDEVMEEEEDTSDDEAEKKERSDDEEIRQSSAKWGEFEGSDKPNISFRNSEHVNQRQQVMITASERRLFREEFMSIMYQNFIDGKDMDFDYNAVDNNEEFDNLDIKTTDAEEKYFDSESPEDVVKDGDKKEENVSEDELDKFMERLNEHHSIKELSNHMYNL